MRGCCFKVKRHETYEILTSKSSLFMKCQHTNGMYPFETGFNVQLWKGNHGTNDFYSTCQCLRGNKLITTVIQSKKKSQNQHFFFHLLQHTNIFEGGLGLLKWMGNLSFCCQCLSPPEDQATVSLFHTGKLSWHLPNSSKISWQK